MTKHTEDSRAAPSVGVLSAAVGALAHLLSYAAYQVGLRIGDYPAFADQYEKDKKETDARTRRIEGYHPSSVTQASSSSASGPESLQPFRTVNVGGASIMASDAGPKSPTVELR